MKLFKSIKAPMRVRTRVITSAQAQESQPRVIRLCRECVNYSEVDDACKVFNVINHSSMSVSRIKSLHCRTREDLCGMDARYYEQLVAITAEPIDVKTYVAQEPIITYHIDGSVGISTKNANVVNYYDTLYKDFDNIY